MNKLSWGLFAIYFLIFVGLGLFLYFKYSNRYLSAGAEPIITPDPISSEWIYYSQGNNLYRLNPDIFFEPNRGERVERFQSTGEVTHLDISKNNQNIAYNSKNSLDNFEIWQVNTINKFSVKIATRGQESLNGYIDFLNPKFSPDGGRLSFVGRKDKIDSIFIKNLSNGQFQELFVQAGVLISDYTWTKDGQNIIYCTTGSSNNACWKQEIGKNQAHKIITGEVNQISATIMDKIIFILVNHDNSKLLTVNSDGSAQTPLTDLASPKTVSSFSIDQNGEQIAYTVKDNGTQNIYMVNTDGTNRFQITQDNLSSQGIISPTGDEVGFFKQNDGIIITNILKSIPRKVTNLSGDVKLLNWR
ncbi:MAG: hypothetical protein HW405_945 [Candidatus Berkelbacteria bacterium]|nr:hypothetical protein [Candidatus Berkelbacteria bacterium]